MRDERNEDNRKKARGMTHDWEDRLPEDEFRSIAYDGPGTNFSRWMFRLFAWDGLLPAAVWSLPLLLRWCLPGNRGIIELVAVVLPVVGFFVRFYVGTRYIFSNGCGKLLRGCQVVSLVFGILVLVLIDCVMMLTHVMPPGEAFATKQDVLIWTGLYTFYLSMMALALYPGAEPTTAHPGISPANSSLIRGRGPTTR
jgi:hypothetical protein